MTITPIDLDALIDTEYAASVEAAQARRATEAAELQRQKDSVLAVFTSDLVAELGDPVADALGITYSAYETRDGWRGQGTTEPDPQTSVAWQITQVESNSRGRAWVWNAEATPSRPIFLGNAIRVITEASGQFRPALLAKIGWLRTTRRTWEIEEGKRRTANALREEQRQREKQAEDAWRDERRATFQTEQARLQALVDVETDAAKERLWTWPEDVTVTLYALSWCKGVGYDEGEHYVVYADGWTSTDQLDADGYVTLEETQPYGGINRARQLKLDMQAHKPVWARKVYTATAELPTELRYDVRIAVPGIDRRYDHEFAHTYWVEDPDEAAPVDLDVALPLPWVRDLVDRAAGRTVKMLAPAPTDDPFDVPY